MIKYTSEIAINKNGIIHSGISRPKKADRLDWNSMNRMEIIKDFIDKTMVKTEEITYDEESYVFSLFIGRALGIGVSHGEFIYALLKNGFIIKPQHDRSYGCWFNLDWDEFKRRYKEHFPGKRW